MTYANADADAAVPALHMLVLKSTGVVLLQRKDHEDISTATVDAVLLYLHCMYVYQSRLA